MRRGAGRWSLVGSTGSTARLDLGDHLFGVSETDDGGGIAAYGSALHVTVPSTLALELRNHWSERLAGIITLVVGGVVGLTMGMVGVGLRVSPGGSDSQSVPSAALMGVGFGIMAISVGVGVGFAVVGDEVRMELTPGVAPVP